MSNISPTFDINTQRGRFYIDADMLADNNACSMGYNEYVAVFGKERRKFNKTLIRKAVAADLPMYWLAYRSDAKYGTRLERDFDEIFERWFDANGWHKAPTDAQRAKWWIEVFEKNGYI